jgi:WD40 repeat protein
MDFEGTGSTPGGVAISPDKQLVAAGINDETLVWRIGDGELVTVMKTEQASLMCLEFSPDGRMLMRGCPGIYPDQHLVQIWNTSSWARIMTLEHRRTDDATFSPDGSLLATVTQEALHLWQVSEGALLRTFEPGAYIIHFSPDGTKMAAASWIEYDDHKLFLWNLQGDILWETKGPENSIGDFSFSDDGQTLTIVTRRDGELQRYDAANGTLLETHQFPVGDAVREAAIGPNEELVALSYDEREIEELFRISDQSLVASIRGGESNLLEFSRDSELLATQDSYDIQICEVPEELYTDTNEE